MLKYQRGFVADLDKSIRSYPDFIHVVLGPRQVGKTTGIQQLLHGYPSEEVLYASADGEIMRSPKWITEQWLLAESQGPSMLLVIDEIQKVENWSEAIKKLWDEQKRKKQTSIRLILLGSSSLEIQSGLSESLTGRFLLHKVRHWSFKESRDAFGLDLKTYLRMGGYPASYQFKDDPNLWLRYMNDSILNPVLGKDILSLRRVKSPSLFRQAFDLACSYGGQEISYTKLLGQLQEKGNTDLIKHYLELFEGAFLLKPLSKFSSKKTLTRGSSPKILPLCPALYSATKDADLNDEEMGRAFEIVIGNALVRLPGELLYWREGSSEVDYVLRFGKKILAVEVKWGEQTTHKGLAQFKDKFPSASVFLVNKENYNSTIAKIEALLAE